VNAGSDERPQVYSIRISTQAAQDIVEAVRRLIGLSGDDAAEVWRDRLLAEIATLAENPRRFAVDERAARRLKPQTRRMLFRPTPGSAAYHVYYTVQADTPDGPRVGVMHVRHAARRPITREEALRILGNQ